MAKLVGKFYNPATQQTSIKRSYVPFSVEGVNEYLVHHIDVEDENIEQVIEDGSRMEDAEVIDEYTSEDNDKADYFTDDEIEMNEALLKYRVVNKRDASSKLKQHYNRIDDHMLEKDKE